MSNLVLISSPVCTWAVYFLTTSEDVQQNLYKEMDHVLGKGPITHEKIEQLRWVPWKELQKVISHGGHRGFMCWSLMPSPYWARRRHPKATPFFFLEVIKPQDDLQHRESLFQTWGPSCSLQDVYRKPFRFISRGEHRINALAARPKFVCLLSCLVSVLVFQK